jgi:hypothetical protein
MPVSIKEIEPKKPVPIAQTPEFKKLQDLIDTAKVSLDDVARQIVVVESKLMQDAMAQAQAAQSTTPDGVSNPGDPGNNSIEPMQGVPGIPVSSPGMRDRLGFEEAIEDMRRIAGLR